MGLISPRDFVDLIVTKETDTYLSTNGMYVGIAGVDRVGSHWGLSVMPDWLFV